MPAALSLFITKLQGADRIRALQIGVNMFRLLKLLVPCLPDTHVALGETVRRANGVSITVSCSVLTSSDTRQSNTSFDHQLSQASLQLLHILAECITTATELPFGLVLHALFSNSRSQQAGSTSGSRTLTRTSRASESQVCSWCNS